MASQQSGLECVYFEDFHDGMSGWSTLHFLDHNHVYWHPDTYFDGTNTLGVMWCGTDDSNVLIGAPGYGNYWIQYLTREFDVGPGATMSYSVQFDVESVWDYTLVQISNDNGATYTDLATLTGNSGGFVEYSHALGFSGPVVIRFAFYSDVAWSNEEDPGGTE